MRLHARGCGQQVESGALVTFALLEAQKAPLTVASIVMDEESEEFFSLHALKAGEEPVLPIECAPIPMRALRVLGSFRVEGGQPLLITVRNRSSNPAHFQAGVLYAPAPSHGRP